MNGILRVTFEPPRFGRAPKGNLKEDRAEGILRVTYEPPTMLHLVADSGGPHMYPPPPVEGGTGVFFNGHGSGPESGPYLERL